MEQWKDIDIKGFEGLYRISNAGDIFSVRSNRCLAKTLNGNGYLSAKLCNKGYVKTVEHHRLLAIYFIPNPDNKPEVNHINGVKNDCRLENLEWATDSENMRHAFENKLNKPHLGSANGNSKLTAVHVKTIRDLRATRKYTIERLAYLFSVSTSQIKVIVNRKQWSHV